MSMEQTLRWKFDVSAFRLIGRDLITDRVTALFELVKNSYDANAREVSVTFTNVGAGALGESVIEIKDDGYGMTFEDIRDKWMVIGTSSKRTNIYSPEPFHRRCVGEKGIGRFAVDKLGDRVSITTKKVGEPSWITVHIDWEKYENLSNQGVNNFFTEIDNAYEYTPADNLSESGTKLEIRKVREEWEEDDIKRFLRETTRIVSPFTKLNEPFSIHVYAPEYKIDDDTDRSLNAGETKLATLSGSLSFGEDYQESLLFDKKTISLVTQRVPIKSFGGIKMTIFFFDGKARSAYNAKYPYSHIDGIKIYRDGLITTPFAEAESEVGKQRDILGIDKNRWADMLDKVSARELIGYVDITKEGNPKIIDATNRQDFTDNKEYRELKDFIQIQLHAIYSYKQFIRNKEQSETVRKLAKVGDKLDDFAASVHKIVNKHPALSSDFAPVLKKVRSIGTSIKTALKSHKAAEREFKRKENVYMSIMSLQEYAIQVTHAVRTSLSRIKGDAQFFNDYYPNPDDEELFKQYAKEIYDEMLVLDKVIDYMLGYTKSNLAFEEMDTQKLLKDILGGYTLKFRKLGIQVQYDLTDNLFLTCNEQFMKDIIQNIVDNSVKAMDGCERKILKCSCFVENEKLVMMVSDTGVGIPKEKWEWVFGLYNTTTESRGGAGVGLYVVRSRVKALGGEVFFTNSEFVEGGATIRMEFPFNNSNI